MLYYIRSILTLIFAISMMYLLLDCEIKYKKNRYFFRLYVTIVLIIDGLVLLNFGYIIFMELYPLLVQLPAFLAFVFISRFKFIKVFFVHLTLVAITTSVSVLGMIISYFFEFNNVVTNVSCYIIYVPLWFLVYKYLRPSFLYMLSNTDKGWYGFCTIPLSYTLLIYSVSRYNITKVDLEPRTFIICVLLLILTFAAYMLIIQFFKKTREQLTLLNEQNLFQMQVAAARVHLEELKDSQEKTMLYRHDMRHHLNLISAYLADNNNIAAQKYISEVGKSIESASVEKYCSNYTVNLILSSYIAKAKNEGISINSNVELNEKNDVTDMDLCILFANALENAINACKHVPVENDRTINIICKTKNNKIFIQITNSYQGTVLFADELPIRSEENHGLGTKSIAAVAQKYNGVYSFTAEDGIFRASIIL